MSKNNAVKDDTAIWLSYLVFILYIFVTIDWKGEVIVETYTVMHDRAIWHLVWSYILELVVTHSNMDLVSKANAITHDKPMISDLVLICTSWNFEIVLSFARWGPLSRCIFILPAYFLTSGISGNFLAVRPIFPVLWQSRLGMYSLR